MREYDRATRRHTSEGTRVVFVGEHANGYTSEEGQESPSLSTVSSFPRLSPSLFISSILFTARYIPVFGRPSPMYAPRTYPSPRSLPPFPCLSLSVRSEITGYTTIIFPPYFLSCCHTAPYILTSLFHDIPAEHPGPNASPSLTSTSLPRSRFFSPLYLQCVTLYVEQGVGATLFYERGATRRVKRILRHLYLDKTFVERPAKSYCREIGSEENCELSWPR